MSKLWGREPALVLALVGAGVQLATAFGLNLSGEQQGGIATFTLALVGFLIRSQVKPTD